MNRNSVRWCLLVLLFLCTRFAPTAQCKDATVVSKWTPQSVTLSGQRADWPNGSIGSLEDKEASLGLCNDSHHVYVMLFFRNPQWALMIKSTGLTVWLDPQGKKKKQFMVKLVGGPSREELMKASGKDPFRQQGQMPPGMDERRNDKNRSDTAFTCFQKDYIIEKSIPLSGQEGPAAGFATDQGFFVYEFSVPLKESSVLYYGLGARPGQTISLGLIWGEMDQAKMRERGEDSERGMGGGMGGGPGGGGGLGDDMGGGMGSGMGGPGGMGMGGERRGRPGEGFKMPEKQEVWLKVQLAAPESETAPQRK
jgi:hypothetical protein